MKLLKITGMRIMERSSHPDFRKVDHDIYINPNRIVQISCDMFNASDYSPEEPFFVLSMMAQPGSPSEYRYSLTPDLHQLDEAGQVKVIGIFLDEVRDILRDERDFDPNAVWQNAVRRTHPEIPLDVAFEPPASGPVRRRDDEIYPDD